MKSIPLLGALLITLVACTTTTGVMSVGPDTYRIIASSDVGIGSAQKAAYKEANAFAAARGLYMIPIRENSSTRVYSVYGDKESTYELTFRLVTRDDPEYGRPNLEPVPDVTVKVEKE